MSPARRAGPEDAENDMRAKVPAAAVFLAAFVLSPPAAAPAAETSESGRTYSARAGYWIPEEDIMKDNLGSGLSFGASYSLPIGPRRWVDFEIIYWSGEGDLPVEKFQGGRTFKHSKVFILPLLVGLRTEPQQFGALRLFVFGSAGLTIVKEEVQIRVEPPGEDTEGTNTLSSAFLGVHFGGGAQYPVSPRSSAFIELRYSLGNADTDPVGGIIGNSIGLGGLGVYGGVRIR